MVMEFDFQFIRPLRGDQRMGFEELVCQLARREPPDGDLEFRRIEGAGGDGGVEAYWTRSDGRKTGYQAKFHLRSNEVGWSEIDKSVKSALSNHPELDHYVVAIPCNLTDHTGKTKRSRTGWEQWDVHKSKWEAWAVRAKVKPWPWKFEGDR